MAEIHAEKLDKKTIKIVGLVSFLMGFAQAVLAYVMSSYFKEASGTENVGIFYLVAYSFELIILFSFHKIISALGKSRALLFLIFLKIPVLFSLVLLPPSLAAIVAVLLYIVAGNMGWMCLDMILEYCSMDRLSGRIRGLHLTVINAGILAGPFLSMHILDRYNFQGVFMIMLVIYSIMFCIALLKIKDFNHEKVNRLTVREIFFKFLKRKNVLRAYYISFMLEFFYALMVIYTPIYLRDLGMSWDKIGIIFTVMLIPFVILQYPVGLLADKKYGEKELLIFSIFVMGATTLGAYFVQSTAIVVWSLILFLTRIGASMVEILRDSYFYKRIDSYDIDLIDFFRTSRAVAFIAAAILSTVYLFIFPVKAIFVLVAIVAFSALYPAMRLVDNKSEREIKGTR